MLYGHLVVVQINFTYNIESPLQAVISLTTKIFDLTPAAILPHSRVMQGPYDTLIRLALEMVF